MKSFQKELWFELPARVGFVNITPLLLRVTYTNYTGVGPEVAQVMPSAGYDLVR
jgi:hypothetical protein